MFYLFTEQAVTYYAPTEVRKTPITLFRAREFHSVKMLPDELSEILQDPTWGWNKFSPDPVEVHFVPGNHETMMTNPHVQVLAERLGVSLDQII
ncbi:MAG: hypothetical protein GDA43_12380 [Hormoscilla sp. SP5CHS1]|nr:hypothetical protein [Hormoscilla sp. SP5CHS1]